MNKIRAQFCREAWEHKGALVNAPLALVALFILISGLAFCLLQQDSVLSHYHQVAAAPEAAPATVEAPGKTTMNFIKWNSMGDDKTSQMDWQHEGNGGSPVDVFTRPDKLHGIQSAIYSICSILMTLLALIYALGALFSDRRDKSILFFKSLPVSETRVVLTRLAIAAGVMPLMGVLAAFASTLIYLGAASLFGESYLNLPLAAPWGVAKPFTTFAQALLAWLLSAIWALPLVGWLMLASALARKSPFMIAVVPLLILMLLEQMFLEEQIIIDSLKVYFAGFAVTGDFFGTMPVSYTGLSGVGDYFQRPGLWLGLILTAGFMSASIALRNRRFEI